MVKVTENKNVKIIFSSYLRQKWIDLRQTKTKRSAEHSTHRQIHLTGRNASFLWYLSGI